MAEVLTMNQGEEAYPAMLVFLSQFLYGGVKFWRQESSG